MTVRSIVLALCVTAAGLAAAFPAPGKPIAGSQMLRFFDKPVSMKVTHADGTVVTQAPFPEAKPGDTLDVDSLDYVGTHRKHAATWLGSTHLRCVFRAGPPTCESHVAIGGSLLVFTGNPGKVTNGTGIYQGAIGRVISAKQLANDATDIVLRIQLAG
jgi:hypothetical protein